MFSGGDLQVHSSPHRSPDWDRTQFVASKLWFPQIFVPLSYGSSQKQPIQLLHLQQLCISSIIQQLLGSRLENDLLPNDRNCKGQIVLLHYWRKWVWSFKYQLTLQWIDDHEPGLFLSYEWTCVVLKIWPRRHTPKIKMQIQICKGKVHQKEKDEWMWEVRPSWIFAGEHNCQDHRRRVGAIDVHRGTIGG